MVRGLHGTVPMASSRSGLRCGRRVYLDPRSTQDAGYVGVQGYVRHIIRWVKSCMERIINSSEGDQYGTRNENIVTGRGGSGRQFGSSP